MGKFNDLTIKKAMEEINQSYFLPDIQREYVWLKDKSDEKKIEKLFDSILRGYPIGTFLFWKIKKDKIETSNSINDQPTDKINFQLYKFIENYHINKPHNEKINPEQINADDLTIILDGQQRLTSLYIALKGSRTLKEKYLAYNNPNAYKGKKLYLNLKHIPEEENPEDNYQFEFHEEPKNDEQHHWFKVGDILGIESLLSYSKKNNLSDEASKILENLKEQICTKENISFFQEEELNLDKVLEIFIRVNSGGTILSKSDLLMSILTANFDTDIRKEMNELVDSMPSKGISVMPRDPILKTCLLLTESNHIFQLRNFNKTNIKKIEDNWDKITQKVYKAIELLKELGYAKNNLSSAYILSTIAYYLYHHDVENLSKEEKEQVLKFIRNAQIKGFFSNTLDAKLTNIAKAIKSTNNFKEFNNDLKEKNILKITNDDIEEMINLQYDNKAVFPVLQILYPNLDYKNLTFHIDHIYPKSQFGKKLPNRDWTKNYIYNLQLLEGEENLEKGKKKPETWLKEHYNSNQEITEYKKRNYIDTDFTLSWDKNEDFDKMRRENILAALKSKFNL